jgi:hypothetical protein
MMLGVVVNDARGEEERRRKRRRKMRRKVYSTNLTQ